MHSRPDLPFRRAVWELGDAPVLSSVVYPIRGVVLNGRKFSMSSLGDSIVKARTVEEGNVVERVGEIIDLWEHEYRNLADSDNPDITINTFALIRWYKTAPIFAPRSVRLWFEEL
jgi:hypothetical protein